MKGIADNFTESEIFELITGHVAEDVELLKVKKINTKIFFIAERGQNSFMMQVAGNSDLSSLVN